MARSHRLPPDHGCRPDRRIMVREIQVSPGYGGGVCRTARIDLVRHPYSSRTAQKGRHLIYWTGSRGLRFESVESLMAPAFGFFFDLLRGAGSFVVTIRRERCGRDCGAT